MGSVRLPGVVASDAADYPGHVRDCTGPRTTARCRGPEVRPLLERGGIRDRGVLHSRTPHGLILAVREGLLHGANDLYLYTGKRAPQATPCFWAEESRLVTQWYH